MIALINLGKCLETLSAPNLEIKVILPFSFFGLILLQSATKSSAFKVGPHLIPIGFSIPLQNSTCPPSNCLVLSPIPVSYTHLRAHETG